MSKWKEISSGAYGVSVRLVGGSSDNVEVAYNHELGTGDGPSDPLELTRQEVYDLLTFIEEQP